MGQGRFLLFWTDLFGGGTRVRHLFKIVPLAIVFFTLVMLVYRYGSEDLLIVILCFTITVPIIYLVVDRFVQKNNLLQMKEEALRAELAFLKNQIDPHFFFNTLNNLYGLAVTKSDLAPAMILKLSDLMRFTIYEGKKDHVLLRDELAYLQNYLAIHQIRAKMDKVDLKFDIDVEDDLLSVPPLMLIMLVENAIKHGIESQTEKAFVHLHLKTEGNVLDFRIENNYEEGGSGKTGIGLTNLKRRLKLLFPGRHSYEASGAEGVYRAHLRLNL